MPYVSDAQRRWAHTPTGTKALGGPEKVKEWDRASKGKDLPMRSSKGSGPVSASYASGGEVLTQRSRFAKEPSNGIYGAKPSDNPSKSQFINTPDVFRSGIETNDYEKTGKGGELSKLTGDKSLKPIKPRT